MPRATQLNYTYRANLLVKPSMMQFIVLSTLLHLWVVLLFGDTSGNRGNGLGGGRTFLATLERAASPAGILAKPRGVRRGATTAGALAGADARVASPSSSVADAMAAKQENAAPPTEAVAAPVPPPAFEKIPILTNEVKAAVKPFAVAPIPIEAGTPLSSVAAAPLTAFTTIAPISTVPKVARDEAGFAVFVAPILERASIAPSATPMLVSPTLPPLVKAASDREFANYVPPPVVAPAPRVEPRQPTTASATPTPVEAPVAAAPPSVSPRDRLPPVPFASTASTASSTQLPASATTLIEPLRLSPALKSPEIYMPAAPITTTIAPIESPPVPSARPSAVDGEPPARPLVPAAVEGVALTLGAPQSEATARGGPAGLLNFPLPLPFPATPLPPPPAPRLDLDALRRQAREVGREASGPRTLLPFATVAKEPPKRDMEKIFDKALKRPDCKEAYSDLGLAAVIPLVRDAVKDGGCKW